MNITTTPQEVMEYIERERVDIIDLRFIDFPGIKQHFSVPAKCFEIDAFKEGIGFDGSSIRGWQIINESDMLVMPDPRTAFIDPFSIHKTLVLICNIHQPITLEPYARDPRTIALRADEFLKNSGIADTAFFGPEAEFFIFDDVRFDQNEHEGYYHIDSEEGRWNTGRDEKPNLSYKPRYKEGYFPVPPSDKLQNIRDEISLTLQRSGINVECHHHEVATGGQCEIDIQFAPLVTMADSLIIYKYVVRNTAHAHNQVATFMPKPIWNDNGSGMHTHASLWKGNKNIFYGDQYAGLSEAGLHAIGGLLRHARAVLAFTNPSTNSYKRLVPGFEAPVNLFYSQRNRSAAIRIPTYSSSEKAKRFEFRCPDSSCNPYLAFSAMLMAMIDGIQNKIDPGEPMDQNTYELSAREARKAPKTPATLEDALKALERDHDFLTQGNVFSEDVIETWINYKRDNEVLEVRTRPHPWEFAMYLDI